MTYRSKGNRAERFIGPVLCTSGKTLGAKVEGWGVEGGSVVRGAAFSFDKARIRPPEQIPLAARIFAVVDVWDALTSDRPYRPAWSNEKAVHFIREQSGKHFDPQTVEAFLKLIAE